MRIRSLAGRGRGLLRSTLKFRDACYCVNIVRVAIGGMRVTFSDSPPAGIKISQYSIDSSQGFVGYAGSE